VADKRIESETSCAAGWMCLSRAVAAPDRVPLCVAKSTPRRSGKTHVPDPGPLLGMWSQSQSARYRSIQARVPRNRQEFEATLAALVSASGKFNPTEV
jgi:hypothetical protein